MMFPPTSTKGFMGVHCVLFGGINNFVRDTQTDGFCHCKHIAIGCLPGKQHRSSVIIGWFQLSDTG